MSVSAVRNVTPSVVGHSVRASLRFAIAIIVACALPHRAAVSQPPPPDSRRTTSTAPSPSDSTYASPALRALVARVSDVSHTVPIDLLAFRASVQSEIGIALRIASPSQGIGAGGGARAQGQERVMQVEQVASTLSWGRGGEIEQHIVGYRSRSVTTTVSALTVLNHPWVIPVLYGDRLALPLGSDDGDALDAHEDRSDAAPNGSSPPRRRHAFHPFGADRDSVYTFRGGDTIAVLRLNRRKVTLVRIMVLPRIGDARDGTLRFRGLIDVDAERAQIVRMHGQFVKSGLRRSLVGRALAPAWHSMLFADLQNGEFNGKFWLPTTQRIETQVRSSLASNFRPIVRVASRFRDYELNDSTSVGWSAVARSHAQPGQARLTFTSRDTLDRFREWSDELGATTGAAARAADFDDVAPESWASRGAPLLEWRAERVNDVFRFNRVEGTFTGAAVAMRFRDAVPGLSVGANAGWAWKEETARGTFWSRLDRGAWTLTGRAERALVNTNDFRPPLDYEQSLMAMLVTADDYDYLDRTSVVVGGTRALHLRGSPTLHVEIGTARDGTVTADVRHGLIHLDSAFRANRAIAPGQYVRSAIGMDIHPDVTGDFLVPGVGMNLWYERGDGALNWQRVEARLTARHASGPFTYAGRLDGIALVSRDIVPQQLIEFGDSEGLPGYAYKEFGGDRAALLRGAIEYQLPWLRAPIRVGRGPRTRFLLPGISPSLALSVQSGWADARQASTRKALSLFGTRTDSSTGTQVFATRPTDGLRSTISLTARLFGGSVGIGLAKAIGAGSAGRAPTLVFGVGQVF